MSSCQLPKGRLFTPINRYFAHRWDNMGEIEKSTFPLTKISYKKHFQYIKTLMSTFLKYNIEEFLSLIILIRAWVLSVGVLPHVTLWYHFSASFFFLSLAILSLIIGLALLEIPMRLWLQNDIWNNYNVVKLTSRSYTSGWMCKWKINHSKSKYNIFVCTFSEVTFVFSLGINYDMYGILELEDVKSTYKSPKVLFPWWRIYS